MTISTWMHHTDTISLQILWTPSQPTDRSIDPRCFLPHLALALGGVPKQVLQGEDMRRNYSSLSFHVSHHHDVKSPEFAVFDFRSHSKLCVFLIVEGVRRAMKCLFLSCLFHVKFETVGVFAGIRRFVMSSHLGRFDMATCPEISLLVILELRFLWPSCELKRQACWEYPTIVLLYWALEAMLALQAEGLKFAPFSIKKLVTPNDEWGVCASDGGEGLSECEIGESVVGNILDFLCVDQDVAFSVGIFE